MMKIQPTLAAALNNLTPLNASAQNALKTLVGQTLNATITQAQPGQVSVQINGQTYQAQTALNLKPQDQIQVKVEQQHGQIRLVIQPQTTPQDTLQAHYRQLLPQQISLQQSLQLLSQPQLMQQLPPAAQAQLTILLDQLLRPQAPLDGKRIKQALDNSGQFLESKLAKRQANPQHDAKAQLFKLQQTLSHQDTTPSLTRALGLVNDSLNKITLNQLQQLEYPLVTQAELPLRHEQDVFPLNLEIRKQTRPNQWEAMLYLSLHQQQDVICKITWVDERYFNALFYIENAPLRAHFEQALPELKAMFEQAQLPLRQLNTTPVKPSFSQNAQKLGLIDIKI
jgi:hypothetical protein